jgi:hypothetical protein
MGHAVLIQAYDYRTKLATKLGNLTANGLLDQATGVLDATKNIVTNVVDTGNLSTVPAGLQTLASAFSNSPFGTFAEAANYEPEKKGAPLASISLFLPENLQVNYNSSYSDVSLTEELGILGFAGNFVSDASKGAMAQGGVNPYAIAVGAFVGNKISSVLGGTGQLGSLAAQGAGVFVNPQMQLLYKGVALRTFQLEFLMTPKSPAEAKTIQNVCDTLTYYSLPGISGAQVGKSGQFLTPPQIFSIDFKFLGGGLISNIFNTALTNSGLGFLNEASTSTISNANSAKLFKINDCVLEDVSVDYAPNGWSAYKDGYPVQTRLTLQFKEMTMLTKDQFKGSQIAANYNNQQQKNAFNDTSNPTSSNFIGI